MRPKRPHIATLDQVRVKRIGDDAVIEYLDPAILPVVILVGPDADRLSDAELLDRHNAHLRQAEALSKGRQHVVVEIPPGRRQIEYSVPGVHRRQPHRPTWAVDWLTPQVPGRYGGYQVPQNNGHGPAAA